MICTSIGDVSSEECLKMLAGLACAEIRLDLLNLTREQVREVFARPMTLIATCRDGRMPAEKRGELLMEAVEAGASHVDLDGGEDAPWRDSLIRVAKRLDCRVIFSQHDFEGTPSSESLQRTVFNLFENGADIVKVACMVRRPVDAARIISLYDTCQAAPGTLVALGMGSMGKWTRCAALVLGAPFTYAAPDNLPAVAPGQIHKSVMERVMACLSAGKET